MSALKPFFTKSSFSDFIYKHKKQKFWFLVLSGEWVQHCWWRTVRTYGNSSWNIAGSLQAATAVCLSPVALEGPQCHFPQFSQLVMVTGSHAGCHSCGLLLTHCDGHVSKDHHIRIMPVTIATSCCQLVTVNGTVSSSREQKNIPSWPFCASIWWFCTSFPFLFWTFSGLWSFYSFCISWSHHFMFNLCLFAVISLFSSVVVLLGLSLSAQWPQHQACMESSLETNPLPLLVKSWWWLRVSTLSVQSPSVP